MPTEETAVHVIVTGRVQGVGFRYFVLARAQAFQLTGWVQNLPNGAVEAYAEGPRLALQDWVTRLHQGPPMSRVEEVRTDWDVPGENSDGFEIR